MASHRDAVLFGLWGGVLVVASFVLYHPRGRVALEGRLRWLTIFIAFVVGWGLVLTAFHIRRSTDGGNPVPALTVVVAGIVGGLDSLPALQPWAFPANNGFAWFFLAVVLLIVAGISGVGYWWYRTGSETYPLLVLAGFTASVALDPLDDAHMLAEYPPLLYPALAVALVGMPILLAISDLVERSVTAHGEPT